MQVAVHGLRHRPVSDHDTFGQTSRALKDQVSAQKCQLGEHTHRCVTDSRDLLRSGREDFDQVRATELLDYVHM